MTFYEQAAEYIKKHEGYRDKPYWDTNAYRIGYGSDTITTNKNGAYKKVVQGDVTTKELASIDLQRRIKNEFEPRIIAQVGASVYNKLHDGTKIALLSVTYNYGSLPKNVVAAVKTGDNAKIASAVGSLSANVSRRKDEASLISSAIDYAKSNPKKSIGAVVVIVGLTALALYLIHRKKQWAVVKLT